MLMVDGGGVDRAGANPAESSPVKASQAFEIRRRRGFRRNAENSIRDGRAPHRKDAAGRGRFFLTNFDWFRPISTNFDQKRYCSTFAPKRATARRAWGG